MTEDQKKPDDAAQTSEAERRDFLTKAFAAAGALAASGMLAGAMGSSAEAQEIKVAPAPARRANVQRSEVISNAPLKYAKLANGHEMTLGGQQLNDILVREGLLNKDLAGKSSVMTLKLEWS
ncbi:MAG: hypothetical protein JXA57_17525 [Armatimonadetes bacterium]|nr:hypothetical protein [Armatimonadota bacterium]